MLAVVVSNPVNGDSKEFEAKITIYVVLCAIIAAIGDLMWGDLRKHQVKENNYCKYDNQCLQLFTSSLYLAALVFSFVASKCCSCFGRRPTMQTASLFFLVGVVLNAVAQDIYMLIIGRILLDIGVSFANQTINPLKLNCYPYIGKPSRVRGALNILFQLDVTIGIFVANVVNYFTSNLHPNGWCLSLGLAGVPALILCLGSLAIAETPTSLIERGKLHEGLAMLRKDPWHRRRLHRVFQQFTGINAIMFYAPVLFQTVGFKSDASLLSSVIMGTVNVVSTIASVLLVNRAGRRALLLEACAQMFVSQVVIGALLAAKLGETAALDRGVAWSVVVLVCVYVSSFAWSWGPLGWLIPSETFPLETRTAGFAFAVSANMLFTFLIAQAFLSMMCKMRAGIFFFFAGWIVVMAAFVVFLLPETKGVPNDEMVERVWKKHPYWKRSSPPLTREREREREEVMAVGKVDAEIFKARSDKREYRRIVLPNSLEVLLISDSDTDKVQLFPSRLWKPSKTWLRFDII
ncbi:Sugar transport protein 8 [Acorus calamus]|uniref:Sugar transport protein 8 n=1 Tax=Acorus calamus TaxID=4465 RepID=A0AAV9CGB3_ACOCL|nr:Sugar transport protein 8 [Acorus calamus]